MPRSPKRGLDYFSLDVDMLSDNAVAALDKLHERGFDAWMRLLLIIYANGYYAEWSEPDAIALSYNMGVEISEIRNIVQSCIDFGLFDAVMYKTYNILTSKAIQERYRFASQRRTDPISEPKYWLLDGVPVDSCEQQPAETKQAEPKLEPEPAKPKAVKKQKPYSFESAYATEDDIYGEVAARISKYIGQSVDELIADNESCAGAGKAKLARWILDKQERLQSKRALIEAISTDTLPKADQERSGKVTTTEPHKFCCSECGRVISATDLMTHKDDNGIAEMEERYEHYGFKILRKQRISVKGFCTNRKCGQFEQQQVVEVAND